MVQQIKLCPMLVCYDPHVIVNLKMKLYDIFQELTALNKNLDFFKMCTFEFFLYGVC